MKSCVRALVILSLGISTAASAKDFMSDWSLFPEVMAESVRIQVPKLASTSRPTEIAVTVGLPNGCYKADIAAEHEDDFTHVLKPSLHAAGYPCVQISRYEYLKVDLGTLQAGEHRLIVDDVNQPSGATTLWVADDGAKVATE